LIKIPKKQLYNLYSSFASSRKSPSLKLILQSGLFLLIFIALPYSIALHAKNSIAILLIFYLLLAVSAYLIIKKFYGNKSGIALACQEIAEKINTLKEQIDKEIAVHRALEFKISRYNSLKDIIQQINVKFDLGYIKEDIVNTAFTKIARNQGVCLLYLVDAQHQRLRLEVARKQNPGLVIKAKEGDIFDKWVLRHSTSLLIEDIRKDFRFDIEKIGKEEKRHFSSLISSALVSENKMLGVLRLDNLEVQFFSQDDLRFLNTISDLGAVTLENLELFRATQELAIKDDLTSFYRKGYFLERLKEELNRSQVGKKEISLLMLDIDHFKEYNDRFGHIAGDIVLRSITHAISEFFKGHNILPCRFGGEEFCVLLPEIGKKDAFIMAERLRKIIAGKEIILRRQKTHVTVSIGVATYPLDATSEETLLHKADILLYRAKENGRDRVCST